MIHGNLVLAVCMFAAGVLARDVAQDYREQNKTFLPAPPMRSELAPINPRCPEPSPGWIATQPDGARWTVHCLKGLRT